MMSKGKGGDGRFDGRHFDREIIILCVRWYLRYKLSLRDLVEMMAERGLSLAHTTIMRWVKRFTQEFVKRWNRFANQQTISLKDLMGVPGCCFAGTSSHWPARSSISPAFHPTGGLCLKASASSS